jgi:transcription termination factor NusB
MNYELKAMKTDKRTRARELTMQALYQFDVQGPDIFELLDGFYIEGTKTSLCVSSPRTGRKGPGKI